MAAFNIKCTHCGSRLETDTLFCGRQVQCPKCRKILTVPQPPAPPELAKKFHFFCPQCSSYMLIDGFKQNTVFECPFCMEIVTAVPATERACPFCREMIKINAKLCKSCKKEIAPLGSEAKIDEPAEEKCCHCGGVIRKPVEETGQQPFFDRVTGFLASRRAPLTTDSQDDLRAIIKSHLKTLFSIESLLLHLFMILICIDIMANMALLFQKGVVSAGVMLVLELLALGSVIFFADSRKLIRISIIFVVLLTLIISLMVGRNSKTLSMKSNQIQTMDVLQS